MNRSILIVICDFLLVSLLAFSTKFTVILTLSIQSLRTIPR